jgi:antitoxin MazE
MQKARVIKIGNSRGIRLPKSLIEEVGLGEVVLLEAKNGVLVVRPAAKPRDGWSNAFKEMAERKGDVLLDAETASSSWDREEWGWK